MDQKRPRKQNRAAGFPDGSFLFVRWYKTSLPDPVLSKCRRSRHTESNMGWERTVSVSVPASFPFSFPFTFPPPEFRTSPVPLFMMFAIFVKQCTEPHAGAAIAFIAKPVQSGYLSLSIPEILCLY